MFTMTIMPVSVGLRCPTAMRFLAACRRVSLTCLQFHSAACEATRRVRQLQSQDGANLNSAQKLKLLLVSIVPPRNDCGVRIVMYRHLIDRSPFELHVASNADFADGLVIHTQLRLPYLIHRLRKSRFGPRLAAWVTDYENLIWPLTATEALEKAVQRFQPHIV